MADKPEYGAGDVPIMIDGQEKHLRPTLEACIAISKLNGGLAVAIQKCGQLDFDMICEIVAHGLGATSGPQRKLIAEAVFKGGVISVSAACIEFVRTIANAGQRPADDDEEDGESGPLAQPSAQETITADY